MSVNLSTDQFEQLLSTIGTQRRGSFANANITYDGRRDTEIVEAFLSAVTVYKSVENISDQDAIQSLPLVLKGDAATWWNGIKQDVITWTEFQKRLRHAFAPTKPPHLIYQQIFESKQSDSTLTENFIIKKRVLFAQLPEPAHEESQQLDMIYGLLHLKIREKISRNSFSTFDELLQSARSVEELLLEKRPKLEPQRSDTDSRNSGKPRCHFCRHFGHTIELCRKRAKADSKMVANELPKVLTAIATQAPSPSRPHFACYGCGASGVVRSRCPTCSSSKVHDAVKTEGISFCSFNVQTGARLRPMVGIAIGSLTGTAYIDSCAKTSVASYGLYTCLQELGYHFESQNAMVTLADGFKRKQDILTTRVPVNICDRVISTTFIVFPEARNNRTLLGVGFIQDAHMVLNIPQLTWHFIDQPHVIFELKEEEADEVSVAQVETTPEEVSLAPTEKILTEMPLPDLLSPMTLTPETMSVSEDFANRPYQLIPIQLGSPVKRRRTQFDGYSPILNQLYRDAEESIRRADMSLTASTRNLFPSPKNENVGLNAISVDRIDTSSLNVEQGEKLKAMLKTRESVFELHKEPTNLAEHSIDTGNHNPLAMPPYRLSPPRQKILKEELDKMVEGGIIEPCVSPWSAPVVLIPKKDGSMRVCIDYRKLNAITVPDIYLIPRVDDLLHAAKPTPFMSTLDLSSGYWQVKVK